jgi:hypothetical protein
VTFNSLLAYARQQFDKADLAGEKRRVYDRFRSPEMGI